MPVPTWTVREAEKGFGKRCFEACSRDQEKRSAAIKEYERLVSIGEIEPKDRIQVIIERAKYGHPDNMSTQAARRVCKKRGIDWENYTDWDSYIKVS